MDYISVSLLKAYDEGDYWIARMSGGYIAATDDSGGLALDSSDNIYVTGSTSDYILGGSRYGMVLAKHDKSGNLIWQRFLLEDSGDSAWGRKISLDGDGNIYVTGYLSSGVYWEGLEIFAFFVAKFNNDGTLLWQRSLDTFVHDYGVSITVDDSGNVYVLGVTQKLGGGLDQPDPSIQDRNFDTIIVKYDANGTILWRRRLGDGYDALDPNTGTSGYDIVYDGVGNLYIVGTQGYYTDIFITKYDINGNLLWLKGLTGYIGSYSYADEAFGVTLDGEGNIYLVGYTRNEFSAPEHQYARCILVKYDTNGNILWERLLGEEGFFTYGYKVATDGENNVYVIGISGSAYCFIAKYSKDGNYLWARDLVRGGIQSGGEHYDIKINSDGDICISGLFTYGGFSIAKLPGDGSLTGTHPYIPDTQSEPYTYSESSLVSITPQDFVTQDPWFNPISSVPEVDLTPGVPTLIEYTSPLTSFITAYL